ncbi:MAG TPA: allantoinase AllB [Bryobacteraceae bacterium]
MVLRSRRVVIRNEVRPACIAFESGRILAIEEYSNVPKAGEFIDAGDSYVLPGLVDTHVHVNEPGRSEWEGFQTATRAAAAGGVTALVDMPLNAIPATTSPEALAQKREAARGACCVDYAFWGGVVPGNEDQLLPLAEAGVRGFKCFLVDSGVPEFPMVTEEHLARAMPLIAKTGLPLLVHAEFPELLRAAPGSRRYQDYVRSRPPGSEVAAVRLMIRLCRAHHCRVHIVHLSSAEALADIRRARAEGLPFTVETCPHYLYFAAESIPDGATQHKCAPPIRDAANRELLWKALADREIDLLATDHSPCPPELKLAESGDFMRAWGGIASLSVALSAAWTMASARGFSIVDIVRWMSQAPAQSAGFELRKGSIAPGYDADLVVFNPGAEFEVHAEDLHFRHPVSPYLGERLKGRVSMTFVRGRLAFANGAFPNHPFGEECCVE